MAFGLFEVVLWGIGIITIFITFLVITTFIKKKNQPFVKNPMGRKSKIIDKDGTWWVEGGAKQGEGKGRYLISNNERAVTREYPFWKFKLQNMHESLIGETNIFTLRDQSQNASPKEMEVMELVNNVIEENTRLKERLYKLENEKDLIVERELDIAKEMLMTISRRPSTEENKKDGN